MRLPLAEINTPPPQSQGQSEADFEPSHTAREKVHLLFTLPKLFLKKKTFQQD